MIVLKRGGIIGKIFGCLFDGFYFFCVNLCLDDVVWKLGCFYFFDRCFVVEDINGLFFNFGDLGFGVFFIENENLIKLLGIVFVKFDFELIIFVCRID